MNSVKHQYAWGCSPQACQSLAHLVIKTYIQAWIHSMGLKSSLDPDDCKIYTPNHIKYVRHGLGAYMDSGPAHLVIWPEN